MATLEHEIRINAPVEKVWNVLTDLEQVGNYNPLVSSVRYISQNKTGVGASRECHFIPKGSGKERVTDVKDRSSISMELYESDWPLKYMRWTNYLSSENGSTVVKTITEYKPKFGILGSILDTLMIKSKFNRTLIDLFQSLKDYVENKG